MSKRKEKISAFLDDDMHRDELMSFSLSAEADDAKVAQRYLMVGDAMRGEMSNSSFVDVSQAIREAIAGEETYSESPIAAQAATQAAAAVKEKAGFFDFSGWFKPVAGMAVAATVAVVMVTTLSQQSGDMSSTGSPVAVNTVPAAQQDTRPVATVAVSKDKATDPSASEQINPYINQHLEYATQDALQGRLPYVRAVSYDVKK
ncbi:MAG: sigma-E factor negative regulatory protein [Proteobacteria bacterium]|nr:sigma-E factor negative regulatory protein [Pseudomonadota bacterium]